MTTQRILPSPEIIFGRGSFNDPKNYNIFYRYGKHFLICTGKMSSRKKGYLANLILMIKSIGAQYTLLEGLSSNIQRQELIMRVQNVSKMDFDAIITLGGNSVIDCAKAIAILCHPSNTSNDICTSFPIIAIPTLPGYAEKICPSVMLRENSKENNMAIFSHRSLIPKLMLIDPNFLKTLPNGTLFSIIVSTVIRYIEQYITDVQENKLTDNICEQMIKSLLRDSFILKNHRQSSSEIESIFRIEIIAQSHLSNTLDSISTYKLISNALTEIYDIPYNKAMKIIFPIYMDHIKKLYPSRLEQLFRRVFNIDEVYQHNLIEKGIKNINAWAKHLGIFANDLKLVDLINTKRISKNDVITKRHNYISGAHNLYNEIILILNKIDKK